MKSLKDFIKEGFNSFPNDLSRVTLNDIKKNEKHVYFDDDCLVVVDKTVGFYNQKDNSITFVDELSDDIKNEIKNIVLKKASKGGKYNEFALRGITDDSFK